MFDQPAVNDGGNNVVVAVSFVSSRNFIRRLRRKLCNEFDYRQQIDRKMANSIVIAHGLNLEFHLSAQPHYHKMPGNSTRSLFIIEIYNINQNNFNCTPLCTLRGGLASPKTVLPPYCHDSSRSFCITLS